MRAASLTLSQWTSASADGFGCTRRQSPSPASRVRIRFPLCLQELRNMACVRTPCCRSVRATDVSGAMELGQEASPRYWRQKTWNFSRECPPWSRSHWQIRSTSGGGKAAGAFAGPGHHRPGTKLQSRSRDPVADRFCESPTNHELRPCCARAAGGRQEISTCLRGGSCAGTGVAAARAISPSVNERWYRCPSHRDADRHVLDRGRPGEDRFPR